jgi:hypothetical protein
MPLPAPASHDEGPQQLPASSSTAASPPRLLNPDAPASESTFRRTLRRQGPRERQVAAQPSERPPLRVERASDMRAFYAQPCILTHSSLDLISDCAPAFSAVSVGNQIAESERLKYGLPAWLVATDRPVPGILGLPVRNCCVGFVVAWRVGARGSGRSCFSWVLLRAPGPAGRGRLCAPRRAGSARPCRRGSRWRPGRCRTVAARPRLRAKPARCGGPRGAAWGGPVPAWLVLPSHRNRIPAAGPAGGW